MSDRGTGRPRRGTGRHVAAPAALARRRGRAVGVDAASSTASPSTAGGTSTSASQLADAGIDAHGFDLRGFGGSGGQRASIDRWSQLHDDLEERLVGVRSIAPSRPLVLFGHSLGGLISLGYVLDGRARPDLLVLSAPAISARIPLWQRALVSTLRRVRPGPAALEPPRREHAVERSGGRAPRTSRTRSTSTSRRFGSPTPRSASSAGSRHRSIGWRSRRSSSTAASTGSCRPRRARRSRAATASRGVSTRASATSSTTSPPGRRWSPTRSTGSATRSATCTSQPRSQRDARGESRGSGRLRGWGTIRQLKTASGERRRAESVARPQTRGT